MKIIIDPEYKETLSQDQLDFLRELETVDVNDVIPEDENEENLLPMESD